MTAKRPNLNHIQGNGAVRVVMQDYPPVGGLCDSLSNNATLPEKEEPWTRTLVLFLF